MYAEDTSCCAVRDIHDLQDAGSPKEALRLLFSEMVYTHDSYIDRQKPGYSPEPKMHWNEVAAFYMFTEVFSTDDEDELQGCDCDNDGYCGCGNNGPIKLGYGTEFAAYIREHKLGALTESESRPNRTNHPEHHVKVYVWAPDLTVLKALTKKNPKLLGTEEITE